MHVTVRVSITEQTSENQIKEIEDAGFKVEPHRLPFAETSLSYSLCKLQKDIVENTIKKQLKYRGKNG